MTDPQNTACFKAYDIRGRLPDELNPELARQIGVAYAEELQPSEVVLGYDIRLSSRELTDALADGLMSRGVNVVDIGLCGTEEVYFATAHLKADGGIMVTASHNPANYNGMKLVREDARPISNDTGLEAIRERVAAGSAAAGVVAGAAAGASAGARGTRRTANVRPDFVRHLLSYIDRSSLKPLKVVVNSGNGGAGLVVDALEPHLPFDFVKIQHEPDGSFPNGIPNPLLQENREATARAVRDSGADLGLAWDGDFDRCFFFDEKGRFIEGYYLVGLLARTILAKWPGEKIIHDPRLTWATIATVEAHGGTPVQSKTGHAFIKERMRLENAVYGGEMSAHHYFREFSYCDSGMIPWLLICELLSQSGKSLGELVEASIRAYPSSGEINHTVEDPDKLLQEIERRFTAEGGKVDHTDGLSVEFQEWRFSVRKSNTEPLVRLNVESRGDAELMKEKTEVLLGMVRGE